MSGNINKIRELYDSRSEYGEFSTLAPSSRGSLKSKYVATVFDEALIPILKKFKKDDVILDYGCGTGIFMKRIENLPPYLIGGDISFEMLRIAKNIITQSNKSYLLMVDGVTIPIRTSTFDCILAREVLCHIPDKVFPNVLKELHRCLKPGGKFILLDQVSQSPKWQNYPKTPLITKRSVENIIELAGGAGFSLTKKYVVRRPRFFWIYLFQFKLLPSFMLQPLAKLEVWFNKRYSQVETNRWHDVLFELTKKSM